MKSVRLQFRRPAPTHTGVCVFALLRLPLLILLALCPCALAAQDQKAETFESLVATLRGAAAGAAGGGRAAAQQAILQKYARHDAAEKLGKLKDARAVQPLLETLRDPDPLLRKQCAQALGTIGDRAAVGPLSKLLEDSDPRARFGAAAGLYRLGQPTAGRLIEFLRTAQDENLRAEAAAVLGAGQETGAAAAVIAALQDRAPMVRHAAATALAAIKPPAAVGPLTDLLAAQDDELVKRAVQALVAIGDARAVEPLIKLLATQSPYSRSRGAAIEALGALGDPRATDPLAALLKDDPHKSAAAAALGTLGTAPAVRALLDAYRSAPARSDATFAAAIEKAVRSVTNREAVPDLLHCLDAQTPTLCCLAADVLGQMGESRAAGPLAGMLRSDEPDVKGTAINVLPKLGEAAVPELLALLAGAGGDDDLRGWIVLVLGEVGDKRAVQPLLPLLASRDPYVRLNTFEALGKIGDPSAVPALEHELAHPDARIRRRAAEALARIQGGNALAGLARAMTDRDETVRALAARGLGGQPSDAARTALRKALADETPRVRSLAAAALAAVGTDADLPALKRALDDGDEIVRADIVFALSELDTPLARKTAESAAGGADQALAQLASAVMAGRRPKEAEPELPPQEQKGQPPAVQPRPGPEPGVKTNQPKDTTPPRTGDATPPPRRKSADTAGTGRPQPAAPPAVDPGGGARVAIDRITRTESLIVARISCKGLTQGSVLVAELTSRATGAVIQRVSCIVRGAQVDARFRAPLLGWEPGAYGVRVVIDGKPETERAFRTGE
ncbi:MAG: HEAT repeat domain-containing protein [Kiritimatiellae bacterium]|nr:HEAT repeat domain-containing protein [Kiritimatiellia bacterium]